MSRLFGYPTVSAIFDHKAQAPSDLVYDILESETAIREALLEALICVSIQHLKGNQGKQLAELRRSCGAIPKPSVPSKGNDLVDLLGEELVRIFLPELS